MHVCMAAGLLISMVTEVKAHYRFKAARIDERIAEAWSGLMVSPVVAELYQERYRELLQA